MLVLLVLRLIQKYRTLITSTCVGVANFYQFCQLLSDQFCQFLSDPFRQFLSDQFWQLLQGMVSWNQIEQRMVSVNSISCLSIWILRRNWIQGVNKYIWYINIIRWQNPKTYSTTIRYFTFQKVNQASLQSPPVPSSTLSILIPTSKVRQLYISRQLLQKS